MGRTPRFCHVVLKSYMHAPVNIRTVHTSTQYTHSYVPLCWAHAPFMQNAYMYPKRTYSATWQLHMAPINKFATGVYNMCTRIRPHANIFTSAHTLACIYIRIYMDVYICVHTNKFAERDMYIHTKICSCTYMYVYLYLHTYICLYIYVYSFYIYIVYMCI